MAYCDPEHGSLTQAKHGADSSEPETMNWLRLRSGCVRLKGMGKGRVSVVPDPSLRTEANSAHQEMTSAQPSFLGCFSVLGFIVEKFQNESVSLSLVLHITPAPATYLC